MESIDEAIHKLQKQLKQNQLENLAKTAGNIYEIARLDYDSGKLDQSREIIVIVLDILNQTEESITLKHKGKFNALLGSILGRTGDVKSALAYELEAAEQLLQSNQIFDITEIYKYCGVLLFYLGDNGSAYEYLQKALNLAEELDQSAEKAWIQLNIGGLLIRNRKYSEALEIEQEAESIFRTLEDEMGLAYILNAIGSSQTVHGIDEKA